MLTPDVGHRFVQRGMEAFGSAGAVLSAPGAKLATLDHVSADRAGKLRRAIDQTMESAAVDEECERLAAHDVHLVSIHDSRYPRLLHHIPDPPQLLWVRGELREDDALGLAMVGSRRCTHYGREQSDRLATQAARAGLCVVSGGAHGIDAAAHRGAMKVNGRTIAVVGSGLANPYPKENQPLFDQIAEPGAGRGALVSELPMNTAPHAENFPRRNRIISGLTLGVLVVEAAARSGALITARLAVEEHGRELMALPGRVDSASSEGCHKMIREGWATLVTGGADVLDGLGETGQLLKAGMAHDREREGTGDGDGRSDAGAATGGGVERLTSSQQQVVGALDEPRSLDQVVAATGLSAQQVQAELTVLEIQGTIQRQGGLFVRRRSN